MTPKLGCTKQTFFGGDPGNPQVFFDTAPTADIISIDGSEFTTIDHRHENAQIIQLTQDLPIEACQPTDYASYGVGERVVVAEITNGNSYWIYSSTDDLQTNDLTSPLQDGGKAAVVATTNDISKNVFQTLCANVERTFLNEDHCAVSTDACTMNGKTVGPFVVCGSPNEVANDHTIEAGVLFRGGFDLDKRYNQSTTDGEFQDQRQTTWMEIALHSEDQLRQRVAWALSQILVVSPGSIGNTQMGEGYMNYYDIFVRNAFGNYFDILKEVTYSPVSNSKTRRRI